MAAFLDFLPCRRVSFHFLFKFAYLPANVQNAVLGCDNPTVKLAQSLLYLEPISIVLLLVVIDMGLAFGLNFHKLTIDKDFESFTQDLYFLIVLRSDHLELVLGTQPVSMQFIIKKLVNCFNNHLVISLVERLHIVVYS